MSKSIDKSVNEQTIRDLLNNGKTVIEISKLLNVSRRTIYNKINLYNINLPEQKPKFDINCFDKIDDEFSAYWLGFLYADGYISKFNNQIELSLKSTDKNHLIKFSNFLKDSRPLDKRVIVSDMKSKDKVFTRCRYLVCNKHFHDQLINLGCKTNKSLTLTFPSLSIFNNPKLVNDFIRGYIDGDGSLTKCRGRLSIYVCGTMQFLSSIKSIFPDFSDPRKDKRSNVYDIYVSSSKADKIAYTLYEGANIYLDRKYTKFATLCKLHSEKSGNIGEGCEC